MINFTKNTLRRLKNVDFRDMSGIAKKTSGVLKKNYVQLPWGPVVHINAIKEQLNAL